MRILKLTTFVLLSLSLGCSKTITTLVSSSQTEDTYCTKSCITDGTCTGSVVAVSGTALYERRELTAGSGLGGRDTSGSGTAGNFPIRGAEYQVLKNGALFHCGTTSAVGGYSFNLPDDGATYTIRVNSRAFTGDNKVSVLDTPTTNDFYSVSTTVVATGPGPLVANVANATYNGDVKGGAFNILDKLYEANSFLKTNVPGFTVDHKATVYWKRGVNPATYVGGDSNSGLSFYITSTDKIYILGGIDGDVNTEDTDHFDDSIIIHEYGHFLEDNYATSDSPGGSHNGRRVIDPRLAWSEAFASFLMAKVLNDPLYRDSRGNSDGSTFYLINYNIETNIQIGTANGMDTPSPGNLGEGNFREFSVARTLLDLFDPANDEAINLDFEDFWDVFTGTFTSTQDFVDAGHFFKLLDDAIGTDFSALLTAEESRADRQEYGHSNRSVLGSDPDLISGGGDSACEWEIEAEDQVRNNAAGRDEVIDTGFSTSNQLKSNDFFYYYHPGGTLTVYLEYDRVVGAGAIPDLDLYIYESDYTYGSGSTMLTYSNDEIPTDGGNEQVSVNAPAGHYMINVMYWTGHITARATNAASTTFADPARYFLRIGSNSYFCR